MSQVVSSKPVFWALAMMLGPLVFGPLVFGPLGGIAQVHGEELAQDYIDPDGVHGSIVLAGDGSVPSSVGREFVSRAKGGSVLIIPAASDDPILDACRAGERLRDFGATELLGGYELPDPEEDVRRLAAMITESQAVWICAGDASRLAKRYQGTAVEEAIEALLRRGGVVGGCAEIAMKRGDVDFGIDEETALIIDGRTVQVRGQGRVKLKLPASRVLPAVEILLRRDDVADWVQLQRAARDRANTFDAGLPSEQSLEVRSGSLVIVGGGRMPRAVVRRFLELAGGKDAKIVVLPTAVPRKLAMQATSPDFLTSSQVAKITLLPQSRPDEIAGEAFQSALREATGIWFDGGRQWNFVDAYQGTNAVALFHAVLERGGVIGGSSAGATIQGEYLVRGHPLGNQVMMAEGYERGFAFLPRVAIDQHFSQRDRFADLATVIKRYPKWVGVGIDEGTALVVQGTTAQVMGDASVHFLTDKMLKAAASRETEEARDLALPYLQVKSGESIDLQTLAE